MAVPSNPLIEVWKPITGYEGIYTISNQGRIKSLSRLTMHKGLYPTITNEKILGGAISDEGYRHHCLTKAGKKRSFKTHVLTWDHFGDKPRNGHKLQVDHIDEDKANPAIWNLQLLTNRENSIKAKCKL